MVFPLFSINVILSLYTLKFLIPISHSFFLEWGITRVYTEYNLDIPSYTGHISLISLLTHEFKSLLYSYIKRKSKIVLLSIPNLLRWLLLIIFSHPKATNYFSHFQPNLINLSAILSSTTVFYLLFPCTAAKTAITIMCSVLHLAKKNIVVR